MYVTRNEHYRYVQLIEKVFFDIENEDRKHFKDRAINIQKIKLVQRFIP